jgi:RNA polymerase sigma factor (sigma-70 family)
MMTSELMTAAEQTDADLVSGVLAGDRDAFSRIVSRYQVLICSLAYSRIGNLGMSEDIAQETFITAWKHLRLLREPEKLRAWLCGIVRNRIHKSLRQEGREPVSQAESLEAVAESPSTTALPSQEAIGREEEAILWRSLAKIPEIYREPLILYYREHQSIEHVAVELDLTEDAVKQRLSRGRKLLQEEVHTFVESTLRRTAPGHAFSGAVLAALPLPATLGAAAGIKGTAAAKSGFLSVLLVPFIGIFAGIAAQWLMIRGANSRERTKRRVELIVSWAIALAFAFGGPFIVRSSATRFAWTDRVLFTAMSGFYWFFATAATTWVILVYRHIQSNMRIPGAANKASETSQAPMEPARRIAVVAGTHMMMFWGVIPLAWMTRDFLGLAIIVTLMVILIIRNWVFDPGTAPYSWPYSCGPAHIRQLASSAAVVFAVLNLRLDVWIAASHGITVSEVSRQFPTWIVPALTLVLLIWACALMSITKPKTAPVSADLIIR